MTNAFVEPSKDGGYQIEFTDGAKPRTGFATQEEAIQAAKKLGHSAHRAGSRAE